MSEKGSTKRLILSVGTSTPFLVNCLKIKHMNLYKLYKKILRFFYLQNEVIAYIMQLRCHEYLICLLADSAGISNM